MTCSVLPSFAAQQASHACNEDGKVERLWQVIVGTGFKSFQDVFWARSGGEHEERNVILGFTKGARYRETIFARKHYVQHQRVEFVLCAQEACQRFVAIALDLNRVAFLFEIEAQPFREVRLVLHYEDPAHMG